MESISVTSRNVAIFKKNGHEEIPDLIAVEEPLFVEITSGPRYNKTRDHFCVLMRTPGHDEELITGLLFSLGLISNVKEITGFFPISNAMVVELAEQVFYRPHQARHIQARSSACGMCAGDFMPPQKAVLATPQTLTSSQLLAMLSLCNTVDSAFFHSGGTHGAFLFDGTGVRMAYREDVGRHNALDKLVGYGLQSEIIFSSSTLIMTSRASLELVQKAAMAGIPCAAFMGAATSAAIDLANRLNITLIGFLRDKRFNVYCGGSTVICED